MKLTHSWTVVKQFDHCRPTQQKKLNFDKNNDNNNTDIIVLIYIFTDNKVKSIYCNLQCYIFVYVFWLMEIQGINIYFGP